MDFYLIVLRKSFYTCWSARKSPRVLEVNPGGDPSHSVQGQILHFHLICWQDLALHQLEDTGMS